VLRPGDAIQITVFRKPELSGEFAVSGDGSINHPLYQQIHVAGRPLGDVRARLEEFLKGWDTNPYFRAEPLFRVAVGGEVARPNLYTFAPEVTIAQAVAAAGGVTERGQLNKVRVLRSDGKTSVFDLTSPDPVAGLARVHSGDQILVQRTSGARFRDTIAPAGTLAMAAVSLLSVLLR
jgi:polysaccharide export outer membrane protein